MTATERLRALLDERGVEWWENYLGHGLVDTSWAAMDATWRAYESEGFLCLGTADTVLTPEQAVEATLGPREQPPYDELIESLRRDWDIEASWDGLRRFWYVGLTDEGVRKRDEREATLGRGTCRMELPDLRGPAYTDVYVCSECGGEVMVGTVMGVSDVPKWCPWCGRKVEQ